MAVSYFQTYKEIQDKLASMLRTEFRGFSVYFDDNYVNRKPSDFNITKTKDDILMNFTDGHFSNYSVQPSRDESENINDLHIASFDFDVKAFEVV